MSCPFTHLDGSYVLGALSPAERQEFEEHLAHCGECSASVRQLAGLPGLLARVDADTLTVPVVDEPVPDTLLPSLVREVRRSRRRRAYVTAGLAAAAAVTVTVGSLGVAGSLGGNDTPVTGPRPTTSAGVTPGAGGSPAAGLEMAAVGQASMRANVAFESVAWGTRLSLTCTYDAAAPGYGEPQQTSYALVVRTRDGRTEQVATWRGLPGRTMMLDAATASRRADIASVEVRTAEGQPVLKLVTT